MAKKVFHFMFPIFQFGKFSRMLNQSGIKFYHSVKFFVFAHFSPRYGRRIPYASFMIFVGLTGMLVLAVPPDEGW